MTLKNCLNPVEAKKLILREFAFLEKEYDYKIVDIKKRPYVSITYQNSTTALRIGYEPRDRGTFVLLIRLVDGEIPPYPIHIRPMDRLNMFYLDDLVAFKMEDSETSGVCVKMPKESIAQAVSALRMYATDILRGDFGVFMELDKIVKNR